MHRQASLTTTPCWMHRAVIRNATPRPFASPFRTAFRAICHAVVLRHCHGCTVALHEANHLIITSIRPASLPPATHAT
jgi:hypothetical protein